MNQAILKDIDTRFDAQDKVINFLITQVSTLESALKSSQSISQSNVDLDRQNIIRIKSDLKAQGDSQVQSLGSVA